MVSDNILRYTEPSNDLVENEEHRRFSIVSKCWHGFDPLGEVSYYHNDITMPRRRIQVECSEINSPLSEGTNRNNRKYRSRVAYALGQCIQQPTYTF
jgi:hypothetical protein